MAKYLVTHEDGRQTAVFASNESEAKRQANHAETTRVVIATHRGVGALEPPPSMAVSVVFVKP